MKLWTGDEWRLLSENEALHRIESGYVVLEDDDPRTLINAPPGVRAEDPPPDPTSELEKTLDTTVDATTEETVEPAPEPAPVPEPAAATATVPKASSKPPKASKER